MNMLKQVRFVIVASIVLCAVCSVYALYQVTNEGTWPKNWPKELEPLRKQARTLVHSQLGIHEIPFTSRDEFEAAWPHVLAVKSKKAPLILLSSPDKRLGEIKAGVRILSPLTGTLVTPQGTRYPPGAESAIPDGKFLKIGPPWPDHIKSESGALPEYVAYENGKWVPFTEKKAREYLTGKEYYITRSRIDIELVVDGDIVDLNRIPLPADTPIIDTRFKNRNTVQTGSASSDVTQKLGTQVDSIAFRGSGWGTVVLNRTGPDSYEGTYTDTFGGLGRLRLSFTGLTGSGRWWEDREGDDRHRGGRLYEVEISSQDGTITGKWNTTHYGYGSFVEDASFEWKRR